MTSSYNFCLEGKIIPKAMPRLTRSGRAYLPENYRGWKSAAISSLKTQAIAQGIVTPICKAAISITLTGKHPWRSDCANLGKGSVAATKCHAMAGTLGE